MQLLYIRIAAALCCSFFVLFGNSVQAQVWPDTLALPEIEVTATRINQPLANQPINIQLIDSASLSLQASQNIGEVLSNSSTLFIKDNGPGGLATASQRGLSSEQIQVLWEGFPINSVNLGQTDFSLLPAAMFSSVQVSSGTPSSAFGGGAMSGAILLSSENERDNQLSVRQGAGSFGQWQSAVQGSYRSDGWNLQLRSVIERAENDFEYYNRAVDRYENRTHNRQQQENVMATVGYRYNDHEFETKFWVQNSRNDIPGSILTSNSQARQNDQALRWVSSYQTTLGGINWQLQHYFDRVELNYFDPSRGTRSLSTFRRWLPRLTATHQLSKHALLKGEISGGLSGMDTNNYNGFKSRQQLSALINPEFSLIGHRFKIYPALRLDSYSDFGTVLSPSLGLNYALLPERLFLRGQLSRDFNPPSFNALYWNPSGNPNLNAERSRGAEAGLVYQPERFTFSTLQLTGFWTDVTDGIRWNPDDAGTFRPQNFDEIVSRGLEAGFTNSLQVASALQLTLNQQLQYTDAEVREARFLDDQAVGKQLRYVPKWSYQAGVTAHFKKIKGLLQYRFTGRRYTTSTEQRINSLDPYHLVNATLRLHQRWQGVGFTVQAGVRNLLDRNYEIVQWYAMPGRNFFGSVQARYQF